MDELDVLILGSGVAGLTAATRARSRGLRVGVLTKGELAQSTTRFAQGGVAAVLHSDEDSTDAHFADTLAAGGDLCDVDAVRVLVDEGPTRVTELIALGAQFDRDNAGDYELAREGGHSHARVLHAGGAATGAEIERALVYAVRNTAAAIYENGFVVDFVVEDGVCAGVTVLLDGNIQTIRARHVILATGGAGQLFAVTTNPAEATGDGVAMALRAGVAVADTEFVQFHPTALHHPAMPRPLLSEALRGHGALIRDDEGERFIDELSPRDVVSKAMAARMLEHDVDSLWLDATGLDDFDRRFPTIASSLHAIGLNPTNDWLPIAPAAHYMAGGVLTDLWGATTLPNLWACGEVACTGVHGANRLASNSLLEGMVFGARAVDAIADARQGASPTGALAAVLGAESEVGARPIDIPDPPLSASVVASVDDAREQLQRIMTRNAGVLRSADSLAEAEESLLELAGAPIGPPSGPAQALQNLVSVGRALLRAAIVREESRGSHTRADFPDTSPKFRERLVIR